MSFEYDEIEDLKHALWLTERSLDKASEVIGALQDQVAEGLDERDELRLTVKQLEAHIQELEGTVHEGLVRIGHQQEEIDELENLALERTSYCDRI